MVEVRSSPWLGVFTIGIAFFLFGSPTSGAVTRIIALVLLVLGFILI